MQCLQFAEGWVECSLIYGKAIHSELRPAVRWIRWLSEASDQRLQQHLAPLCSLVSPNISMYILFVFLGFPHPLFQFFLSFDRIEKFLTKHWASCPGQKSWVLLELCENMLAILDTDLKEQVLFITEMCVVTLSINHHYSPVEIRYMPATWAWLVMSLGAYLNISTESIPLLNKHNFSSVIHKFFLPAEFLKTCCPCSTLYIGVC